MIRWQSGTALSTSFLYPVAALLLACLVAPGAGAAPDPRIAAMKAAERGPFSRIRWFCNDGSVLEPKPHACDGHGGGVQHGELNASARALREEGYRIANVYADLDVEALLSGPRADRELAQMVIERYLVQVDDGWIMRRALSYRGALQEEDERAGARRLLLALAGDEAWIGPRFLTFRALARALPHGTASASAQDVRQRASDLAERDAGFLALKNKIHAAPAADDAGAVRAYAAGATDAALAADLAALADAIDSLYAADIGAELTALAERLRGIDAVAAMSLANAPAALAPAQPAYERYVASASILSQLRTSLGVAGDPALRLALADAGLLVEGAHFVAASALRGELSTLDRRTQLTLLRAGVNALYGVGLLSTRQLDALQEVLHATLSRDGDTLPLGVYRQNADYLGLVPGWGDRHLGFAFGDGLERLARIEPRARLFNQDYLRGSPMFFYAEVVGGLERDANHAAGVERSLLGEPAGGLRALNPGLARGVLRDGRGLTAGAFEADGVYVLDETTADLPPVAGIITAGEGNPLSHVQLLARNLGIPNVGIPAALLEQLVGAEGKRVVLAVSSGGAVRLMLDDGSLDELFASEDVEPATTIVPDLDKLDLSVNEVLDLDRLRSADSGRSVGPKAAKLGELKARYPEAVAGGLVLPFGVFRDVMSRPAPDGSGPMFDYVVRRYRALEALAADSPQREEQSEALRRELEAWVAAQPLAPAIEADLRKRLTAKFGADGSFGVFVRSDTNVEDLAGFTGAGLNLTVPNVVGVDNIIAAIPRVWASPFTERAFAWRQALMSAPEHVYPSVLIQLGVDADKSGVLVTRDIDTGSDRWLSVAVNEGVGGAVDGQSAESLRIELGTGKVRLMAQASATVRRRLDPAGGVQKLPASGADRVLTRREAAQLVRFARGINKRFEGLVGADGQRVPADVEFGFKDGKLMLFQIRPFVDSAAARNNAYLVGMNVNEAALRANSVRFDEPPRR